MTDDIPDNAISRMLTEGDGHKFEVRTETGNDVCVFIEWRSNDKPMIHSWVRENGND